MQIVIQYNDKVNRDTEVSIDGRAAFCGKCGKEAQLIIQEATAKDHPISLWWYCPDCSQTSQLSSAMGMLY